MGLLSGCGTADAVARGEPRQIVDEAGFIDLAPRGVSIDGRAVSLSARSKIFCNFPIRARSCRSWARCQAANPATWRIRR